MLKPLQQDKFLLKSGGAGGLGELVGVAIFWPTPVAEIVFSIVFWRTCFSLGATIAAKDGGASAESVRATLLRRGVVRGGYSDDLGPSHFCVGVSIHWPTSVRNSRQ